MSAVPEITSRPKVASPTSSPELNDFAIADDEDESYDPAIVFMEGEDGSLTKHRLEAWQVEAGAVDRSVRILPGVKRMISSLPEGRYAVATSGARTYGQFCTPVTIRIFFLTVFST